MSREAPYTLDILRLAASLPVESSLQGANHAAEARSATCGSTIRTELITADGRIGAIAQKVTACAYGQASAALLQGWARGRLRAEVTVMRAAVKAWLEGRGEVPREYAVLAPVQGRAGRHGAVLLPFDALLKALESDTAEPRPATKSAE
jgi:NifU-like protein involved in Fe-S cluster formation